MNTRHKGGYQITTGGIKGWGDSNRTVYFAKEGMEPAMPPVSNPKKFVIHPEPRPKKKVSKYQALL